MHVFVLTATWISEHTLMSEVRGVYAHMHQTITPARILRVGGKQVLITKHEVTGLEPVTTPVQLPLEGGQTDPSVSGDRA
jgi:hypothetical protein